MPDDPPAANNDPPELAAIAAQVATLPVRRDITNLAPVAQRIRRFHPRAHEPWSPKEDNLLRQAWKIDPDYNSVAPYFQRQPGAIRTRARKLKL